MNHKPVVTVIGAGNMGAPIASHSVNSGLETYLIDIQPKPEDIPEGYSLDDVNVRNALTRRGLNKAKYTKRASFDLPHLYDRVVIGNQEDNLEEFVSKSDLVIEAIIENPEIKQNLFSKIEAARNPDTIVMSNTSGIPVSILTEGRSKEFKENFGIMHWFNPPRYMRLIELVRGEETSPEVMKQIEQWSRDLFGKEIVYARDVPGFVANRIGAFNMGYILGNYVERVGTERIDYIFGKHMGSAEKPQVVVDIVGLDTTIHVFNNLRDNVPENDPGKQAFDLPDYFFKMVEKGYVGGLKSSGFYRRKGKAIDVLNLSTFEYEPKKNLKIDIVEKAIRARSLEERFKIMYNADGGIGGMFRDVTNNSIAYAYNLIEDITESGSIADIDKGQVYGFNRLGPGQIADLIGIKNVVNQMEKAEMDVPEFLTEVLASGNGKIYDNSEDGTKTFFDQKSSKHSTIPRYEKDISIPDVVKKSNCLEKNNSGIIYDLSDGVLALQITSKKGTINQEVIDLMHKSMDIVEDSEEYKGLVVHSSHAPEYSPMQVFGYGADLELIIGLSEWARRGTKKTIEIRHIPCWEKIIFHLWGIHLIFPHHQLRQCLACYFQIPARFSVVGLQR